jgi:hypothetical protein
VSEQKTALLWCHTDYPVLQAVRALLPETGKWQVKAFTIPIQTATVQNAQALLEGCAAVCLFIPKTDLQAAVTLTETLLTAAQAANVPRIVWVAPLGADEAELGRLLNQAAAKAQTYDTPVIVIRHSILFSELLHHRREIQARNTLSLPMGDEALLWADPQDVAELVVKGLQGSITSQQPLLVGTKQTGEELAAAFSQQLALNIAGERFAQRWFQAIDVNQDGKLERAELAPYMAELGYSPSEATEILDQADANNDGVINFAEFVHDMGPHLDHMLVDIPTEIRYLSLLDAAFLYDMGLQGMSEDAAQQYLALFKQTWPAGLEGHLTKTDEA